MQIVIDISEELYKAYKGRPPMLGDAGMDMIAQAIARGKPLPKEHGRLIDADNISFSQFFDAGDYAQARRGIYEATTIIELDKESDNE